VAYFLKTLSAHSYRYWAVETHLVKIFVQLVQC